MAAAEFKVAPATQANWPDLEALFEGKGGPSYCWCMAWRPMDDRTSAGNEARKNALCRSVQEGVPIGLVGYIESDPVAWCSVAPRETFVKMRPDQQADESNIWSITCFFVRRDYRKNGLSARMLDEAIKIARKHGARIVEGYPVDSDSPSYRYMGFVPLFEEHGFHQVARAGSRRHVMRRAL